MLYNGSAAVTLVLDQKGRLQADPVVSLSGVTDGEDLEDLTLDAADAVRDAVSGLAAKTGRTTICPRDGTSHGAAHDQADYSVP